MIKRILILERDHQGHRFTGVRVLIDALLDMKASYGVFHSITFATTQSGFASTEFQVQLADVGDQFQKLVLKEQKRTKNTLNTAFAKVSDWRTHVCGGSFDHVYIPYGDGLVQMLAALRFIPGAIEPPKSVSVEAIFMRGSFGYPNVHNRTKLLALFGIRYAPLNRIHLIDPLPYEYIQKANPELLEKVNLIPDPITGTKLYGKTQARQALHLNEGSHWIGCIGAIDARKGVDKLVKAFISANLPTNTKLLLAGKHSSEIRQLISQVSDSRIISIDRYLTELELNQALGALDLVATPYPDFVGSASIVLRAAAGERFCLGADSGWMKRIIPTFQLGALCNVNDQQEFSAALVSSLPAALRYVPTSACLEFVQYGAIKNVYAHWTDMLRQQSGISSHGQRMTWPALFSMDKTLA